MAVPFPAVFPKRRPDEKETPSFPVLQEAEKCSIVFGAPECGDSAFERGRGGCVFVGFPWRSAF